MGRLQNYTYICIQEYSNIHDETHSLAFYILSKMSWCLHLTQLATIYFVQLYTRTTRALSPFEELLKGWLSNNANTIYKYPISLRQMSYFFLVLHITIVPIKLMVPKCMVHIQADKATALLLVTTFISDGHPKI